MNLFLVEDEAPARDRLIETIARVEPSARIAGVAASVREARAWLAAHPPPDLMLLDVQLADGLSFELFAPGAVACPAIFATAYDEFVLEAFRANAIDYVLKPIRLERLLTALRKTRSGPGVSREALDAAANQPRRHLSVHERGKIHLVPVSEILYLRAELKYLTVRTAAREYLVEESLTRLEEEFADAFVRIHRNCLVARAAIAGFEKNAEESESGWAVVIKATGEKLPVSRRQHHVIKEFR